MSPGLDGPLEDPPFPQGKDPCVPQRHQGQRVSWRHLGCPREAREEDQRRVRGAEVELTLQGRETAADHRESEAMDEAALHVHCKRSYRQGCVACGAHDF